MKKMILNLLSISLLGVYVPIVSCQKTNEKNIQTLFEGIPSNHILTKLGEYIYFGIEKVNDEHYQLTMNDEEMASLFFRLSPQRQIRPWGFNKNLAEVSNEEIIGKTNFPFAASFSLIGENKFVPDKEENILIKLQVKYYKLIGDNNAKYKFVDLNKIQNLNISITVKMNEKQKLQIQVKKNLKSML